MRTTVATILSALALGGCLSVAHEPELPLPDRPKIHVFQTPVGYCLSEEDLVALGRYFKKMNEWEAARTRVLKGQ